MSTSLHVGPDQGKRGAIPAKPVPIGDRKIVAMRLVGGGIALWALLSAIGLFVTHVLSSDGAPSWDLGVDTWFEARRTLGLNDASAFGSRMADTPTAIGVTVITVLLLRWRLGRWYESLVVVAAITGELLVFLAVTATVHRARPSVDLLDVAPPTSSFPSGHTAAAVALYGCLAILLVRLWSGPWSLIFAVLLFLIPVVVGVSRLYRGMHYPTDVVVGAFGGGLWLTIVVTTLVPRRRAEHESVRPSEAAA